MFFATVGRNKILNKTQVKSLKTQKPNRAILQPRVEKSLVKKIRNNKKSDSEFKNYPAHLSSIPSPPTALLDHFESVISLFIGGVEGQTCSVREPKGYESKASLSLELARFSLICERGLETIKMVTQRDP